MRPFKRRRSMSYYIMMKFNLYVAVRMLPIIPPNRTSSSAGTWIKLRKLVDLPIPLFWGRGYREAKADFPARSFVCSWTKINKMTLILHAEDMIRFHTNNEFKKGTQVNKTRVSFPVYDVMMVCTDWNELKFGPNLHLSTFHRHTISQNTQFVRNAIAV